MNKLAGKEYNRVTLELLERTNSYKDYVLNDMIVNSDRIVQGIVVFQEVLKEFDPFDIDDLIIEQIKNNVDRIMALRENSLQIINSYVRYGINHCYMILDSYGMNVKRRRFEKI